MTLIAKCPTCGDSVEWNDKARWRPFCSERCRMLDLGDWINEENRIGGNSLIEPGEGDPWLEDQD